MNKIGYGSILVCLCILIVTGCSTINQPSPDSISNTLVLTSISVTPESTSLLVGNSRQFTATANYTNEALMRSANTPTWSVSGGIGSIDATGLFTATSAGAGQIIAEISGIIGRANVSVYVSGGDLAPLKPGGLVATGLNRKIYLTWYLNIESDLAGYKVYRSLSVDDGYSEIATLGKATTFEDASVEIGKTYYYKIKAYDTALNLSYYSDAASATPNITYDIPSAPTNLVASLNGSSVDLNWSANTESDVIGYNIYRRQVPDPGYAKINSSLVSAINYSDNTIVSDNQYYYAVTAVDSTILEGPRSSEREIIYDVTLPVITASLNISRFSPNNDGRYDGIELLLQSNEKSTVFLRLSGPGASLLFSDKTISFEAGEQVIFRWANDNYEIYRRVLGAWALQSSELALSSVDGNHLYELYGRDLRGNQSTPITLSFERDTLPPVISSISDSPDYFSPDGDGLDDTSIISCNVSELSSIKLSIYDADGSLFRNHTNLLVDSSYSFIWDGKSSTNAYKSDYHTFKYNIIAEDVAGNITNSSTYEISTNRCVGRIQYMYADPDPFNARGGEYTDVKYYLYFDSTVSVAINGVKQLQSNLAQTRGAHSVRWYGDYDTGYSWAKDPIDNSKVATQAYVIKISAYDPRGGVTAETTNTVYVDNH